MYIRLFFSKIYCFEWHIRSWQIRVGTYLLGKSASATGLLFILHYNKMFRLQNEKNLYNTTRMYNNIILYILARVALHLAQTPYTASYVYTDMHKWLPSRRSIMRDEYVKLPRKFKIRRYSAGDQLDIYRILYIIFFQKFI